MAGPTQSSVQLVGPGVIRALEPDQSTVHLRAQLGTAMTTHVMERTHHVVLATDDDEALTGDLGQEVPARAVHVLLAPDAHPRSTEPRRLLVGQDIGVVEDPGRQQARPVDRSASGRDLGRRDR